MGSVRAFWPSPSGLGLWEEPGNPLRLACHLAHPHVFRSCSMLEGGTPRADQAQKMAWISNCPPPGPPPNIPGWGQEELGGAGWWKELEVLCQPQAGWENRFGAQSCLWGSGLPWLKASWGEGGPRLGKGKGGKGCPLQSGESSGGQPQPPGVQLSFLLPLSLPPPPPPVATKPPRVAMRH